MPELTEEQWRSFSEHLDQALRMPEAERAVWLVALARNEPQVAAQVQVFQRFDLIAQSSRLFELQFFCRFLHFVAQFLEQ